MEGVKSLPLPSGFPSRHLPFSSKLSILAFTEIRASSKFGQNLTPLVKWQISAPLLANREPVGNQSGTSRENPSTSREGPKMDQKSTKKGPKTGFLKRCADFPDWFRTGSRFEKNGANLRRFWCQLFNDFWRQKSNCFGLKTG